MHAQRGARVYVVGRRKREIEEVERRQAAPIDSCSRESSLNNICTMWNLGNRFGGSDKHASLFSVPPLIEGSPAISGVMYSPRHFRAHTSKGSKYPFQRYNYDWCYNTLLFTGKISNSTDATSMRIKMTFLAVSHPE